MSGENALAPPSYARILSDAEIERIYDGAVRVLLNTGFRIQHPDILKRLEQRGARVDYADQVFWPTREMMRDLEACARRHAGPPPKEPVLRRPLPQGNLITYNGTLYYDWTEGIQRPATLEDVEAMLKVCHVLPEVADFGPTVTAQDVPPLIEPIVSFARGIQITDKPVHRVELVLPGQLPFLEELDSITQGREVRYNHDGCAINNFTIDARATGCLMATWQRNGLERWTTSSCPIAGASAPVTLAGAVVVGVAETIGAWFAGWVLNEDVTLDAIPCSGVMDMRTTRVLFSTPEAVLIDVGLFQVLDRVLGVRPGMLADYTDAKVPGMQAMNDKVFKGLAYAWLTGQLNRQRGTLEAGKAFSPTQMVIDFDINRELAQLAHGMEVTEETLALELIEAYGPSFGQSYIGAEHTFRHFRKVLWYPQLMDRTCWDSPEVERQKEQIMLERAEEKWRDALAHYKTPDIPEEKLRAAEAVVERARQALLV